jgi:hypothetical protein
MGYAIRRGPGQNLGGESYIHLTTETMTRIIPVAIRNPFSHWASGDPTTVVRVH